ncbi:MAG: aspartate 1-decarboxylase [Calditrichaeota bacterium]|nr:aspartate 1-decarboxylase [Calditrichota bacterium]
MLREFFKAKIHRATITQADLNYEGSLTVDQDLLDAAGIAVHEKVDIYNITNGARFSTYVIPGERGSGVIGLNGAAARLGSVGDKIIIVSYCQLTEAEIPEHHPVVVLVEEGNRIKEIRKY